MREYEEGEKEEEGKYERERERERERGKNMTEEKRVIVPRGVGLLESFGANGIWFVVQKYAL